MENYGFSELYRPDGEPEVDIVAVHGLNGDRIKTWTSQEQGICWLKHPKLLPMYLKRARILTWGYNAYATSLMGKDTSSERILQHASTLVAQLDAERGFDDALERPIIFLCHSLGGIIVKRALAYAASRTGKKDGHLHRIYTCTYALLFFGTPHNGTDKARLLHSFQKLASLTIPRNFVQTESSLLRALEDGSETLQNITDQFAPLMSNFRIFFFWEQEKTDLKVIREYIVGEASAAPILGDTERSGIAADHRNMCRFESSEDQGFRTVVAALRRYSQEAPKVISLRLDRMHAMLQEKRFDEAREISPFVERISSSGHSVPFKKRGVGFPNGCSRSTTLLESSGVYDEHDKFKEICTFGKDGEEFCMH